ncbi:VOC family protein [Dactylosporangium sp. CA-233914]|uniref:VOC family protein n=1 Tax=Dactylosporangium sp. CA-233914 TaxID=3239934 RepID=UPI003D89F1A9
MMSSPIVHIDIHGGDEPAQHRFYADLFGWQVNAKGPGYALVSTPPGSPDGALVESEDAPGVVFGVAVDDLDEAVERAVSLGGTVIMPPTDNGWVVKAQITDPAGNRVTLIRSTPRDVRQ